MIWKVVEVEVETLDVIESQLDHVPSYHESSENMIKNVYSELREEQLVAFSFETLETTSVAANIMSITDEQVSSFICKVSTADSKINAAQNTFTCLQ